MRRALPLAALIALVGCGANELAGGGGIETNNTLTLQVSGTDGLAVSGALVRIRPYDWNGPDTSRAPGLLGTTDSLGRLSAPLGTGLWTMEARGAGLGRMARLRRFALSDTSVELDLDTMGTLEGFAVLDSTPIPVGLAGSQRRTLTDSLGRYRLDSLSPGPVRLLLLDGSGRSDTLHVAPGRCDTLPWTGNPELRRTPAGTDVQLDDFRSAVPTLSSLMPTASWYLATDSKSGGTSRILGTDGNEASLWRDLLTGTRSARLDMEVNTGSASTSGYYAQVGLAFAADGKCVDLSAMDSLSLLVRGGDGTLRLDFHGALQDTLADLTSSPSITLPATSTWTRLGIPVSKLAPMSGSSHPYVTWQESSPCILELRLIANSSTVVEIADLVLHGTGTAPFLAPRSP